MSTLATFSQTTDSEPGLSRLGHAAKWCIDLLKPSLFSRRSSKKVTPTAYLDGLRGFAALLVYWQHHEGWARLSGPANEIFENAYGYQDRYYFAAIPGVRLLFTGGHFAVTVFFVLSGYVLSVKPLSLIYSGNLSKFNDSLASAFFRRWLRLHLPIIGTTFLYMTSWHMFGFWTSYPEHKSNYLDEFSSWYRDFWRFSFVFKLASPTNPPWLEYNVHLWSIPVEFRGSIVVYTTLFAFSRSKRNARLLSEIALIFYFLFMVDGWFCSMFLAGLLLCELDLLAQSNDLPAVFYRCRSELWKSPFFYVLFACSIYLSGVPSSKPDIETLRESPGWYYLSYLKPAAIQDSKWFYLFWAAAFLVAATRHVHLLKRFFETRFNQYLGRISFGLYLVHGPVLWILGDRLYAAVGWRRDFNNEGLTAWSDIYPLSKSGPLGLEIAFLAPHLILLPFTLWLAEITTRLFDEPSVRFAQWLYRNSIAG
ncbi:acyltransferase [Phlyctema vagabunda]|uniref:Acyltransferase n=1 Tax=Phlyctema vagabunda TaxID=108571 RepID=A0ABR4P1J1_9HELO